MKKAAILLGVYLIASFSGALLGAMLWADPFRGAIGVIPGGHSGHPCI